MTVHAYKAVKRVSMVEGTSPHQLIALLFEAALSQIAMSQQHLMDTDLQRLHLCVDKAIAIVQELQGCLRDYQSNELSGNLFELYGYIIRTLVSAKINLDSDGFSTWTQLLGILHDAWNSISPERLAA